VLSRNYQVTTGYHIKLLISGQEDIDSIEPIAQILLSLVVDLLLDIHLSLALTVTLVALLLVERHARHGTPFLLNLLLLPTTLTMYSGCPLLYYV
jgi:hypothetical protein